MNRLLDFLLRLFHHGKGDSSGLGYSALGTARSAISSVATIDGHPAGQHPLVRRFMRAVFLQRPALPRYRSTWDPDVVLSYLRALGGNKHISVLQLARKVTMLMLLQSGQRCQTLHLLDTRNMSLSCSRVAFQIGDLLKTSRPGHHLSEVAFVAYVPVKRLCVMSALRVYLKRTLDVRVLPRDSS